MRSNFLSRLVGEPLLHFVVIGAVLFFLYDSRNDTASVQDPSATIEITPEVVSRMEGQFKSVWNRDPTAQEREALISDFIREEVLYRDALALGLDRDDTVIRQRMRLKMEFLSEGIADTLNPDDATLEAWFEPRAAEFAVPPQITFLQIQINPTDDAAAILAQLEAGSEPEQVGRSSLLPHRLEAAVPQGVDNNFGINFYDKLAAAPLGQWWGPVESAYGPHLVKILAHTEPAKPGFEEIRAQVLEAWRYEQGKVLLDAQFEALLARYTIVRSDDSAK